MIDVFPKFVIETDDELGDCLIISKCTFHKELVTDPTKVKGGGWFKYNHDDKSFILYGDSNDFGKSTLDDIRKCIESGNVFNNPYSDRSMVGRYTLMYDPISASYTQPDQVGQEIILLSSKLELDALNNK